MSENDAEVLIVGCGPTGVMLATLLGQLGRRVVILEREREVHPIPRATHIDGETLRNFQATGLLADLLPHTTLFGEADVVDERNRVLLSERINEADDLHGWADSRFFDQPAFEAILRQGLSRYPGVALHLGVEALNLHASADGVTVQAQNEDETQTFRAGWVVGCDGGRSVVRKTMECEMESLAPRRQWIIVDVLLRHPAAARFLPDHFRYRLTEERLMINAHGIGLNRRWEFQLGVDEAVPADDEVLRWVARDIDLTEIEVKRIACYAHNSLVAKSWRAGRVLLAGDAAHMMPPSAGQGMCSGIRDAINLAWKLDRILAQPRADALLDTYEQERKAHVRETLRGTLVIGDLLAGDTAWQRWWRRTRLAALRSLPWLRTWVRKRARRRPQLRVGCFDRDSAYAGLHLPQSQVVVGGRQGWFDDHRGYRFALLARPDVLRPEDALWCEQRGVGVWRLGTDWSEREDILARWWAKWKLDFVLVRPDHQVFACGTQADLARVKGEFDRWWQP